MIVQCNFRVDKKVWSLGHENAPKFQFQDHHLQKKFKIMMVRGKLLTSGHNMSNMFLFSFFLMC